MSEEAIRQWPQFALFVRTWFWLKGKFILWMSTPDRIWDVGQIEHLFEGAICSMQWKVGIPMDRRRSWQHFWPDNLWSKPWNPLIKQSNPAGAFFVRNTSPWICGVLIWVFNISNPHKKEKDNEPGSTNYEPVILDMDTFGGETNPCTKNQKSSITTCRTRNQCLNSLKTDLSWQQTMSRTDARHNRRQPSRNMLCQKANFRALILNSEPRPFRTIPSYCWVVTYCFWLFCLYRHSHITKMSYKFWRFFE